MKSALAACALVVGALTLAPALRAESLPDPTRPPEVLEGAATSGEPGAAAGLQSIIRRERGKPAAIINGEYVVLGGRVGDARLVSIGEDSVTLKGPAGTETLKLMPGIEKTPARASEEKNAPGKTAGKKVNK